MQHLMLVNDEKRSDLNPVSFGYEDCPKDHSHGPEARNHWLIHYIESGKGIFKIDGKEYHLSKNDMFIIPQGVETFYQADTNTPWSYIWIGFTASDGLPFSLPNTLHLPEASLIFKDMKACTRFKNGRSAYLCARLWDLFAIISDAENTTADYVGNALDYIHDEYMTGITVQKIASRLNIDRTYLSTLFKAKTGLSPKQYITRHRLDIAASLLTKSHLSVSTVAHYVGYSDIFSFSKSFKRFYGISPSEYCSKINKG